MRSRYRVRRRVVRRAAPAVRRAAPAHAARGTPAPAEGAVLVGGARDPAETRAERLADRVLRGGVATGAAAAHPTAAIRRSCGACAAEAGGAGEAGPVRRMCAECAADEEGIGTDGAPARRSAAAPSLSPAIAPGAAPARARPAAARAIAGLDHGHPLDAPVRAFFEPRFGRDLSAVRIHDGPAADRAARALDARAFARGSHIALARGVRDRATLAHELAHVVTETAAGTGAPLRRDLCREPPGRTAEPDVLDAAEQADAAAFNTARFGGTSTEVILDMMGAAGRRSFTPETSLEVQGWQADFRVEPDGKVGLRTLETLCNAMIACGERIRVMRLIVDGHDFSLANVATFRFDPAEPDNASTGGAFGGPQDIAVGPAGFAQGYRGLVHTIRHEIDHADVRSRGASNRPWREFRAETIEIVSEGMLPENFAGMMDDAEQAIDNWDNMNLIERLVELDRFRRARDRINQRFNGQSPAVRATHQAVVDRWNAVPVP